MSDPIGPYQSEDGSEVYLPVSAYTINEARHQAAQFAAEMGDAWSRTRYTGKRDISLHDHEEWESCETCPAVPAWCFEVYEGSYRG